MPRLAPVTNTTFVMSFLSLVGKSETVAGAQEGDAGRFFLDDRAFGRVAQQSIETHTALKGNFWRQLVVQHAGKRGLLKAATRSIRGE
ncbi:hypothetical protein D3C72_2255470 [compost metagenome]